MSSRKPIIVPDFRCSFTLIFHLSFSKAFEICLFHSLLSGFVAATFPLLLTFSSVQLLSCVRLFATPWTAACQTSLSITNSWSLPKPMSMELVMPSTILSSVAPSLAFSLSQHQGLFRWVGTSHQMAKVLEFQLQPQSFQWTPRNDLL